jgi:hypothetical protein
MSDLEDLSAKAARLWFEFMQAQAKAAADAAEKLPEVTRSLAEAGLPLAAEVNRWFEGALPTARSADAEPAPQMEEASAPASTSLASGDDQPRAATASRSQRQLSRGNHRRLKVPKSMSRRRARRA